MSASRSPDLRGIAAARDGSLTLAGNSKRNGNFATLGKKHRLSHLATGRIARAMAGLGSSNVANTLLQTLQNLNAQVPTRPAPQRINQLCSRSALAASSGDVTDEARVPLTFVPVERPDRHVKGDRQRRPEPLRHLRRARRLGRGRRRGAHALRCAAFVHSHRLGDS